MLFFLVLSFWAPAILTSGQVWPLNSTPRKTVTLSNRGHVFQEEGVWNYTTMLLMEDEGVLILGAREAIFALDLNNITHKKAMVKWAVTSEMQRYCIFNGKTQTDCHNYIRVLHKMSNDTMFICGTNAFNPTCDIMSYKDGKLTLEGKQQDGKGKCPFDPFLRCASEFVDGKLYSATSLNKFDLAPVVMRSLDDSMQTEFLTSWLNEPNFIGMKHVAEGDDNPEGDDDKIYLFFNERAVEYDAYSKMEVSRVARVCKGDVGGQQILQKKWTSFLKTHLDCPVLQTRLPLLIQDVFLFCPDTWKTCMFYGVFTPQGEMPEYSAVCAYRIQDIRDVFSKGQFKVLNSDALLRKSVTYDGPLPDPRPGACINSKTREKGFSKSLDLPYKTLMFIREHPLMDQAVKPSEQPLLVKKGPVFTRIVVASTTALDGSSHQVMFIGTASGSVLKAVNYDGKMVIIEEVQLFKQSEPVKILRLSVTLGQLYAGSEEAMVQMPLSTCDHYASCMDCVLARDPYCGWDLSAERCIAIKNIHPDKHSEVVQSLRDGNAAHCPAVDVHSTTIIKTFYPGNEVRLLCQPGSNLARGQWSVNNHTIQNSNKYHIHHNNLLILNASGSDAGFYTCTSVESSNGNDYVIQTASYELRLENFMERPSVQPQAQEQQKCLFFLNILVIIPTLILIVLVVWNFYKGHFAVQRCLKKAEESPQSVSVCQEPLQIVQESSTEITINRITEYDMTNQHN
ncbi:semaphorin-4E-like isoform X2 [Tachysurus fulvidraco]|uniref:semaphorin-4E-like isoform X2 n=1 Tax=Tachysurus fulvidraco TaxID=1234273 RepID=UPI001FF0594E|nr:semaphorin-4E-like isoform X2 [Tachysurus fulvidraco]